MNGKAHGRIMTAAFGGLSERGQRALEPARDILADAPNYPDFFDDPTRTDPYRDSIDPQWRRFCRFDDEMAAGAMHWWPHRCTEQAKVRPMLEHLFAQAVEALAGGDVCGGVKFLGCLSHYFGDKTQPAHLVDLDLIERLLPAPPKFAEFHYHHGLEAITGTVGELGPARLLGVTVPEAMWRLADRIVEAFYHCQRYVVPALQAVFASDTTRAEELCSPPMTVAAQITLDVMHTAVCMADGRYDSAQLKELEAVDLRDLHPGESFNDMVYGGILRDASRKDPPWGPPVPAKLVFDDTKVHEVAGLGVLPHSGMSRQRDCFMTYDLPAGVFERFESIVGLHAELAADGAVEFIVELDGKPAHRSGRRTSDQAAVKLAVPIGDATALTLRVTDANDGRSFWVNHAIWGEPVLIRKPVEQPRGERMVEAPAKQ